MKTSKQINTALSSLTSRAKTWREDMHNVLIDIAGHMVEHGEASLGVKALNTAGSLAAKAAVAKWLTEYTAFRMDGDKPAINKSFMVALEEACSESDKKALRECHESALRDEATPWYELGKPDDDNTTDRIFDAVARAEKLIADISKKEKKGEGAHLDLGRYLRAATAQYKAESLAS